MIDDQQKQLPLQPSYTACPC